MLGGVTSPFSAVDTVVRAKAGLRAQHVSACHTLLEQQRKDLLAQEVASRTGIFVKMNRNLLGWARIEHSSTYTGGATEKTPKDSRNFSARFVLNSFHSLLSA